MSARLAMFRTSARPSPGWCPAQGKKGVPGRAGASLQRRHGIFGLQAQQAVVKAAGHLGLGQAAQRAAPHQAQAALVGGLHLANRAESPSHWPGTRIQGLPRGACSSRSPSNWRDSGEMSSGGELATTFPARCAAGGRHPPTAAPSAHEQLDAGQRTRCPPERAVAQNQTARTDCTIRK